MRACSVAYNHYWLFKTCVTNNDMTQFIFIFCTSLEIHFGCIDRVEFDYSREFEFQVYFSGYRLNDHKVKNISMISSNDYRQTLF